MGLTPPILVSSARRTRWSRRSERCWRLEAERCEGAQGLAATMAFAFTHDGFYRFRTSLDRTRRTKNMRSTLMPTPRRSRVNGRFGIAFAL